MQEIWKDICGYEGKYQISNHGRVKSFHYGREKILSVNPKRKYPNVSLIDNRNNRLIHRLVAEHFIPNPDNKPCVNHLDGNPCNNHISNLAWATYSENEQWSYDNLGKVSWQKGIKLPYKVWNAGKKYVQMQGEKSPMSKLNDDAIRYIRKNYIWKHKTFGQTALANKFGVTQSAIYYVVIGKTWTHVK